MTHDRARDLYPILRFFGCDYLSTPLVAVSQRFRDLAYVLAAGDDRVGVGPLPIGTATVSEVEVCLRKLLEAKDCAVRALL